MPPNRANWDDRAAIHVESSEYDIAGFVADPARISRVIAFDRRFVGDVEGATLLHLQCHIGKDTLSWARLGATATGIDFSEPAIAAARRLSELPGTPGRFLVSELYDSPRVLGERFGVVFIGVAAINWLPDISGWAGVFAGFPAPGGGSACAGAPGALEPRLERRTGDSLRLLRSRTAGGVGRADDLRG